MAVLVAAYVFQNGVLQCQLATVTADGQVADVFFAYDFDMNTSQFNAEVEAQAKAAQVAKNGVVFVPSDKIQIAAGRVT
jgi:hypothetical protein